MEGKRITGVGSIALISVLGWASTQSTVLWADEFEQLSAIDQRELSTVRGREGNTLVTVQSNQNLSAIITDTAFSAGEINSGAVQLQSGALENFNGVGLFNFVTGNGNAIDAAIGVNIYLQ